jgi:hypothetical protein
VLPDVTLSVTVHEGAPALATDGALRGYAQSLAAQLGGRMLNGTASDATFATAFSARLDLPGGPAYLYLLSMNGELVELRADIPDEASGRAVRIYEQVIRSFQPV